MKSTWSRLLPVALLALVLVVAPVTASYGATQPHIRHDLVGRGSGSAGPQPFPVSGLAVGENPQITYAFASKPEFGGGNWWLYRPDGTTLRLPQLTWSAWAPLGDGAIGMAGTEAGPELQRVSATGRVYSRLAEHFGLAVSPDHEIVGRLGDHGTAHVIENGGRRHIALPSPAHGRAIAAVQGADKCREQPVEDGGCTIFVNGPHHVWTAGSDGDVHTLGGLLAVSDVNQSGRVAGLMSRRTPHRRACWGVFRAGGHRVFRTCDYYLDSFSPNGHRVLAVRSQMRWDSIRRLAILGRDGHAVASWTFHATSHRSLSQLTWEDDHHLLGVLASHGHWGLVRIGTDGTVEYAGAPVTVPGELSPYNLPKR